MPRWKRPGDAGPDSAAGSCRLPRCSCDPLLAPSDALRIAIDLLKEERAERRGLELRGAGIAAAVVALTVAAISFGAKLDVATDPGVVSGSLLLMASALSGVAMYVLRVLVMPSRQLANQSGPARHDWMLHRAVSDVLHGLEDDVYHQRSAEARRAVLTFANNVRRANSALAGRIRTATRVAAVAYLMVVASVAVAVGYGVVAPPGT